MTHRLAKLDPFPEGKDRIWIVTLHGYLISQWNLHPFLKMAKSNYKKRMRRICQKKTGQISAKLQQFKRIQWAPLEQERYIEWNLGLVNQEWHSSKPLGIHHHHHHIFYICKYIYISLFNPSGFAGRIGFFSPLNSEKSKPLQSRLDHGDVKNHIWTKEDFGLRIHVNMFISQRFHKLTQANICVYICIHKPPWSGDTTLKRL